MTNRENAVLAFINEEISKQSVLLKTVKEASGDSCETYTYVLGKWAALSTLLYDLHRVLDATKETT